MARKSSAALSIVAGSIDGRPKAPDDLTEEQQAIWDRTVASEAADTFRTAALQQLLREYCRAVSTAAWLSRKVEMAMRGELELTVHEFDALSRSRDREAKALGAFATKLRLTNQSRYTPQAAATAARKASEVKLWERQA